MGAAGPAQGICKPEPGARAGAFNYFTGISGCRYGLEFKYVVHRVAIPMRRMSCDFVYRHCLFSMLINLVYLIHSHLFLVAFILTQCTIRFGHGQ
jgi:hypothetical protein